MKSFLSLLILATSLTAIAQNKKLIEISGRLPARAGKTVMLTQYDRFKKQIAVDNTGAFKLAFTGDSGYYSLDGRQLYLEPGSKLAITKKDTVFNFAGDRAAENNLIYPIAQIIKDALSIGNGQFEKMYALEPADLLSKIDKFKVQADQKLKAPGLSSFFIITQKQSNDYVARCLESYYLSNYGIDTVKRKVFDSIALSRPGRSVTEQIAALQEAQKGMRSKNLSVDQKNDFNTRIWANFDMNNAGLYYFSSQYRYLYDQKMTKLVTAERMADPSLRTKDQYELRRDIVSKQVTDNSLKETLYYKYTVLLLKTAKEKDRYYDEYTKLAKDSIYLTQVNQLYLDQKGLIPGAPSPDFNLKNVNDRSIRLSTFKGKYTYIDIWATWCGPCIAEMPALKKIEAQYSGKMNFIGMSIDELKDTEKWKDFVKARKLEGTQLIADNAWDSEFIKKYGIASIPRFILLDPAGNIVSADAPRPSNIDLQKQLDGLVSNVR